MAKDTYSSILPEIGRVVKKILDLRKRTLTTRGKIGKARDQIKIDAIRKQMGLM